MQTTMNVNLNSLRRGQTATVTDIAQQGEVTRRLMSMGLLPGSKVTMMSVAPLDDPISVRFIGFELSIRRCDARTISVELDDEPGAG